MKNSEKFYLIILLIANSISVKTYFYNNYWFTHSDLSMMLNLLLIPLDVLIFIVLINKFTNYLDK